MLEAANGEEALRAVDNSDASIELVLTDVVMPLMNGRELVDHLHVEHPGVRVIYMSGYTDAMTSPRGTAAGGEFIQKPFRLKELTRLVRDVLDSRKAPPLPRGRHFAYIYGS